MYTTASNWKAAKTSQGISKRTLWKIGGCLLKPLFLGIVWTFLILSTYLTHITCQLPTLDQKQIGSIVCLIIVTQRYNTLRYDCHNTTEVFLNFLEATEKFDWLIKTKISPHFPKNIFKVAFTFLIWILKSDFVALILFNVSKSLMLSDTWKTFVILYILIFVFFVGRSSLYRLDYSSMLRWFFSW